MTITPFTTPFRSSALIAAAVASLLVTGSGNVAAQSNPQQSGPQSAAQSAPAPAVPNTAPPPKGYFLQRLEVRNFISEINTRLGIPTSELELALGTVEPVPQVIDLIKPPANPGIRSWQRYRSRFLDHARIAGGQRFLAENLATLKAAEEEFGVPKEIIVSIIGVETVYGRNTGNFNTVAALATLAFDYPPRAELFRRELESLFLLAHERGVNALDFKGSYAGALGLPQFLPSSMRAFAVDYDHDGVIDLRNSPADAIGSVASYLQQNGWQRGGRITLRAKLSADADISSLLAAGLLPGFSPSSLSQSGVSTEASTQRADETAALIDLVTPGKPTEYWLGLQNFYVITRYNRSSYYAMAVNDLAEALRAPIVITNPTKPSRHPARRRSGHP
jgi:membrane-bound lytic murein transglycosylase B